MQKILIIQTAFIGDVVLATGIVEKLHYTYPNAEIDVLIRKGNEALFTNHPFIKEIIIWYKQKSKYQNLWNLLINIRSKKYDAVVNVQRFAATGILTAFSKAKIKIGFDKNPLSFLFDIKVKHVVSNSQQPLHEIERNQSLIASIASGVAFKPKLYPSFNDFDFVKKYQSTEYICIAPASVWFTKQFAKEKWAELINNLPASFTIYLLGAPTDIHFCEQIISESKNYNCINLAGKLSFLQSVALQKNATMNYVNDSAPMHFASAVNAKVTAIYCSTLPSFGFGPLSDNSFVVETLEKLTCKPCGLHGQANCPQKHFKCSSTIKVEQLIETLTIKEY